MTHRLRTFGAAALLLATGLAATPAATAATPTASRPGKHERCAAQLDRAVDRYLSTTARHDARGFEELMAPSYTVILPGGPVFAGKDAGASFIDRFFARTDWTQTFHVTHQTRVGCQSAVTVFDSTYTDEDSAVPLVIALGWTRLNGRWLVELDQNTTVE